MASSYHAGRGSGAGRRQLVVCGRRGWSFASSFRATCSLPGGRVGWWIRVGEDVSAACLADAHLVVSELVANCFRHGADADQVTVEIARVAGHLRVWVACAKSLTAQGCAALVTATMAEDPTCGSSTDSPPSGASTTTAWTRWSEPACHSTRGLLSQPAPLAGHRRRSVWCSDVGRVATPAHAPHAAVEAYGMSRNTMSACSWPKSRAMIWPRALR